MSVQLRRLGVSACHLTLFVLSILPGMVDGCTMLPSLPMATVWPGLVGFREEGVWLGLLIAPLTHYRLAFFTLVYLRLLDHSRSCTASPPLIFFLVIHSGHDSSLSIGEPAQNKVHILKTQLLPFCSLAWVSPTSIIAVGHDCSPVLVSAQSGRWQVVDKLDQGLKKSSAAANTTAFNKFRQMDSRAQTDQTGTELNTVHQNTITLIRAYQGDRARVTMFTTSGVDGKLAIWDVKSIEESMSGLRIH